MRSSQEPTRLSSDETSETEPADVVFIMPFRGPLVVPLEVSSALTELLNALVVGGL